MKVKISGWGNTNIVDCKVYFPKNISEIRKIVKKNIIARGLGRSIGDSSIQPNATIITSGLKKKLYFDKKNGIIEVESGISIKDLLPQIMKHGWFLPVTPGSKNITVGGMVASDVHGKNHHKVGSFRNFIIQLKIINNSKKIILCNKNLNKDFFNFTIGGYGLTGIIYSCKFKLKKIKNDLIYQEKIKNNNLRETLRAFSASKNWEYTVGWLDSSANNTQLGRSVLYRGQHFEGKVVKSINFNEKKNISIPNIFPSWFMNYYLIRLLNTLYYYFNSSKKGNVNIDNFFYPLDKINNWNVAYGKKGFIQYQFLIPKKNAYKIIKQILKLLLNKKIFSFTTVLKFMDKNDGYLSFGQKGFNLSFDFPISKSIYKTLDIIDKIVIESGGTIYLTKDSRVNKDNFKIMNKRFYSTKYRKIRLKNNFFSSLQSKRLEI